MDFLEKGAAQEGLATTTACGHEVQGRELAGDRHVEFSVHHCGGIVGCLFGLVAGETDPTIPFGDYGGTLWLRCG